jgi:Na+-transporting methylmalonyl-CoA/oxaloacetate decarboxylase gamma subunit
VGAWSISLTGIAIVFLGLGILYVVMLIQTKIFYRERSRKHTPEIKRIETLEKKEKENQTILEFIDELEYAAIVASVITYIESTGKRKEDILIKSVRQLKQKKTGWKIRESTIYWNKTKNKKSRGVKGK